MADFLITVAVFVLVMVALGLVRMLRRPTDADKLMAAQILGIGSIVVLLLLGIATNQATVLDVALTLALLTAFASFAFARAANSRLTTESITEPDQ
ncbi:MAG TPA: monovalent cation/H+ antiporter complex subunit F [Pseudomonas sp.]|nr:monovalent cation/H+ antiporter complex subunit F [Pseudomonas sp.]